MKKLTIDYRLFIGFIVAHLFMYITFQDKTIFWYMFTATMLLLMSYSIINEKTDNEVSFLTYSLYGILSGIALFALFWIGNLLIDVLNIPFSKGISKLYNHFAPTTLWHYIVLFLFIVPGEELFWRGFIQKRLSNHLGIKYSVILGALLYASANLYSGYFIHFLSALVGGLFWGTLYARKKSMSLVLVSHLIFDLLIFVLLPFR